MKDVRLMTLDPGHFHAALIQKETYPGVSKRVSVFAPLGPDVADYIGRITQFNSRRENPTDWELDLHLSPDFLDRMARERPGNVVVVAGRNRPKIERIQASIQAGLNVLADKPWIISSDDLPRLHAALDVAEEKGLVAYDIMTERYEITSILQRELVNDTNIFGNLYLGTLEEPAISTRSVHHIMKLVAGVPLRRPAWFFDIEEQGEGLSDVGTHLVDLAQWTAFPDWPLDYRSDVRMLAASRWPTVLTAQEFERITGEREFPAYLRGHVKAGSFEYYCNNWVEYTLRGVHIRLEALWNWEAPPGAGDTYEATFRGSRARVEIRQGKEENHRPELYVVPNTPQEAPEVIAALKRKLVVLRETYTGLGVEEKRGEARVLIPNQHRVGHEAHFAQVTSRFFEYLQAPKTVPDWEKPCMLVKYYISTRGVELARELEK